MRYSHPLDVRLISFASQSTVTIIALFVFNVNYVISYYDVNRGDSVLYIVKTRLTIYINCANMDTMEASTDTFDTTILRKAGLTDSQAKGYLALIENGQLSPVELAEKTGESRTNGYMICEKLEELGLASKKEAKKSIYTPESPTRLRQLLVRQQRQLKEADSQISSILPTLLSTYRLATDKPGVLYLEGTDSLKQIYDDIISTNDPVIRIFPSAYDRDDPAISEVIDRQIERQRKANIKTEVLLRREIYDTLDIKNSALFEARPSALGALDTQIIIYGDNVALTTFHNGVVTSIITSPFVAVTLKQLFLALWDQPAAQID